jgi:uncharacterized damage-inducible protein DinB
MKAKEPNDTVTPAAVVKGLVDLLEGGNAHVDFEDAIKQLPAELRGVQPQHLPYSIWQLVEHIRITQWDILEFSRNPRHRSPQWPEGYWPKEKAPASESAWQQAVEQVKKDRQAFIDLLRQPDVDLYTPFAHGDGQNLLREALLIADHTAYHVGQIVVVRRLLHNWE